LYRAKSLHSFISQTEIHTGPSLGVFETWVRLSYFGAFVNTQVNVRQSHRENDTFRLFSKVLSAAPLHNFCGLVHISEMIFPQKNVRFIAINDGVDSAQGENDFAPLRNIFNEWLVRDTSKKIRAVKRSKGMSGKPVTSKPVYGYLMDEDENFIIDGEAAPVVKQIYSLCLAGNGPTKIARVLTEQQIPTPGTLEYRRTGSTAAITPAMSASGRQTPWRISLKTWNTQAAL
jgi:hypothetical protein